MKRALTTVLLIAAATALGFAQEQKKAEKKGPGQPSGEYFRHHQRQDYRHQVQRAFHARPENLQRRRRAPAR